MSTINRVFRVPRTSTRSFSIAFQMSDGPTDVAAFERRQEDLLDRLTNLQGSVDKLRTAMGLHKSASFGDGVTPGVRVRCVRRLTYGSRKSFPLQSSISVDPMPTLSDSEEEAVLSERQAKLIEKLDTLNETLDRIQSLFRTSSDAVAAPVTVAGQFLHVRSPAHETAIAYL